MALQYDVLLRNARLDVFETHIGTFPVVKLFQGAAPANCAAPDAAGPLLAVVSTASNGDWMNDASGGQKTKNLFWQDNTADASGTAGHFRLYSSAGVCKMQGTVTVTGGGGDMTLDNPAITAGQPVVIGTFTLIEPGA